MPKYIAIIALTLLLISCNKEPPKEIKIAVEKFVPQDINNWQLQPAVENYDRRTIFDYIDGAGEVFLSYRFSKVSLFRYIKENAPEISVEIFEMGTDEDAYGVFSYSRESERAGIGQAYEHIGSLICFWQAHYFVCVRADDKTDETEQTIFQLAKTIDKALPQSGNKPKLLEFVPTIYLNSGNIRYLHTFSALNYHYYIDEENILNLNEHTNIILAEYKTDQIFYLVTIEYETEQSALNAYNNFVNKVLPDMDKTGLGKQKSGQWAGAKIFDEYLVIVLEAPDGDVVEKWLKLFYDLKYPLKASSNK